MDQDTFRGRVAQLVQKSKKALRLYNSMGRFESAERSESASRQLEEWKLVNLELIKVLSAAVESQNQQDLASSVYTLRDRFHSIWRRSEADLHTGKRELILAAENSDYNKAATLSKSLALSKARAQAAQAAHDELQDVLDRGHVSPPKDQEPAPQSPPPAEELPPPPQAKIIPLRKR